MTSSPTPAVLPDARALIADVFRSWDMKRQADAYEAGSYDETLPMQALVARLSPPASDAAVPAGFVMVPVEPTEAMRDDRIWALPTDSERVDVGAVWSAMLAAAPKVASDTGAGLRKAVKREIDGLKGADSPWAVGIRDRLRTALATDATDGATGGGEVLLECEYDDSDGSYALVWQSGYAITAFPTGRVVVTKSPYQPDVPPFGCDVSALATTPGGDLLEQAARVAHDVACRIGNDAEGTMPQQAVALEIRNAIRALSARKQSDDGGEK